MEPASGQLGQLEKAITVYGQPENCTAACRRILEVMTEEAKNVGKDQEICLKILAHNNLIGRIIGKQGATIKKIMEVIKNWLIEGRGHGTMYQYVSIRSG